MGVHGRKLPGSRLVPGWQDRRLDALGISSAIDENRTNDGSHYGRRMYGANGFDGASAADMEMTAKLAEWHTQHNGPPAEFGYEKLIPLFKAEKWGPDLFNNDAPYPDERRGNSLGVKLFSSFINRDLKENNGRQTVVFSCKNDRQDKAGFTCNLERGSAAEVKPEPWMWATDLSGG